MYSRDPLGVTTQKLSSSSVTPDECARAALRLSCAAIVGVRARAFVQPRLRRKALFFITRETSEVIVDICEAFMQRIGYVSARVAEHAGRSQVTLLDVLQVLDDWIAPSGGESFRVSNLMQYAAIEELLPPRTLEPFPRKRVARRELPSGTGTPSTEAPWLTNLVSGADENASDAYLLDLNALAWDKRLGETAASPEGDRGPEESLKNSDEEPSAIASPAIPDEKTRLAAETSLPGADQKTMGPKGFGRHVERWMPPFPPLHTYMDTPVYASAENESEVDKLRRLNEQRLQVEDAIARARGTGYRAIENPYLQLPRYPSASRRAGAQGTSCSLEHEQTAQPLKSEIATTHIRTTNEEVADKAERILAESGGITDFGQWPFSVGH
ncbi:hypothetical protein F1559_003520 [Cyanidiococcus yangmingshanensis]|uniref:Transcription initiation factor TFIID subunit 8 n=1 Tax=Cyanidiococcus yangmingshanensis TaxID=2690220 RepID=A0A7J7IKH1_9RHOD|nr:hypothetical protein F1559_003520 [Cyanidiococcus yangmingshanensis]